MYVWICDRACFSSELSEKENGKDDLDLSFRIDKSCEILMLLLPSKSVFPVAVEGWPSGQWQQTVNLPGYPYVGSNPTPSTTHLLPGKEGVSEQVGAGRV